MRDFEVLEQIYRRNQDLRQALIFWQFEWYLKCENRKNVSQDTFCCHFAYCDWHFIRFWRKYTAFMNNLWIMLRFIDMIIRSHWNHIESSDAQLNVIHFSLINKILKNHWFVPEWIIWVYNFYIVIEIFCFFL